MDHNVDISLKATLDAQCHNDEQTTLLFNATADRDRLNLPSLAQQLGTGRHRQLTTYLHEHAS